MLCPNCKNEIENNAVFCEHCGARVKKSKKWLWITLSVILMSVIATIVIITIQEQKAMEQNRVEQSKLELEQQLQAERIAKEEAERQAELASQEAARNAELVRQEAASKAEAERQAELARQEAARNAEAERQAELARQEAARQAEIARQKEAERQAEIARQREARRQELLSQGLVDLGLPSGTLWKNANEGGDYTRYTYDEAVRKFGNKLPTKQQLEELKNKCTWTWTGSGYKVIGPNGNSILLPAAGCRYCSGGVYDVGTYGCYWSSTPDSSDYEWGLYFYSDEVHLSFYRRCNWHSVRLVRNP